VAGKVDWLVRQQPVEGSRADETTVGDVARDDVVTCALADHAGDIRDRIEASPYPFALVLGERRVLLGRVAKSGLECDAEEPVEHRMDPGPSTVRPHKTAESIAEDLTKRDLRWAIVTSSDGELIGVASRAELQESVTAQG
jgi:predicted transcriptional regulator